MFILDWVAIWTHRCECLRVRVTSLNLLARLCQRQPRRLVAFSSTRTHCFKLLFTRTLSSFFLWSCFPDSCSMACSDAYSYFSPVQDFSFLCWTSWGLCFFQSPTCQNPYEWQQKKKLMYQPFLLDILSLTRDVLFPFIQDISEA